VEESRISFFAFLLAVLATPRWFGGRFESMGLTVFSSAVAGLVAAVVLGVLARYVVAVLDGAASRWINRQ
jgi:membrane glycosyltransferase